MSTSFPIIKKLKIVNQIDSNKCLTDYPYVRHLSPFLITLFQPNSAGSEEICTANIVQVSMAAKFDEFWSQINPAN